MTRLCCRSAPIEVERQVQGRGRVGQCTDADAIDACLGQGPNRGQIHAAGGFELDVGRPVVTAAHGLGDELRTEVVDQDDVGPACRARGRAVRVSRPRSRPSCPRGIGARRRDRRGDRLRPAGPGGRLEPGEVIVLDQNRIVQAEAVVVPAAAPDRVLFQRTPAGRGLARVVRSRRACRRPRRRTAPSGWRSRSTAGES